MFIVGLIIGFVVGTVGMFAVCAQMYDDDKGRW